MKSLLVFLLILFPAIAFTQTAYIQIQSAPGISVFVDGEFKGITSADVGGLIVENVATGERKLKFVKTGFAPQEETITLKKGQVFNYKVKPFRPAIKISETGKTDEGNMTLKTGTLVIQSLPTEISFSIPDLQIATSKTKDEWKAEEVPEGRYLIKFTWNKKTIEFTAEIKEKATTRLMAKMTNGEVTQSIEDGKDQEAVASYGKRTDNGNSADDQVGKLTYNGYTYKTVRIGTQEWTVENLRTTKYNDGSAIEKITDNKKWTQTNSGAYCAYENNESNVATYGYLYNWYAVNTGKLAPSDWRVSSDEDWTKLEKAVGGSNNAGTKLKAKSGWESNGNGIDEYGFSALPGGIRLSSTGTFFQLGGYGYWWSSTANGTDAWSWVMVYNYLSRAVVWRIYYNQSSGFSVRLVRDL
ncbi:MAG: PEGA domain-containing protein [Bacteroidetes bacterium]|nr:PEGA domain-containing protein [Bacteroidota bacterium]